MKLLFHAFIAVGVVLTGCLLLSSTALASHGFSQPAPLNTSATGDGMDDLWPQVANDGAGNWVAVWFCRGAGDDDREIVMARSSDNARTWTDPLRLNTDAETDNREDWGPTVATDAAGNWVATWYATGPAPGDDYDIYCARSTDNGATWTDPQVVNTNAATDSGSDFGPQLITDRAGHWVCVWYSEDDLAGTIGTDADILVSRSQDNGQSWSAPAALNINAATDTGDDSNPLIKTDGAGNWVAVWLSTTDLTGDLGSDSDLFFARSTDNGATWSAPGVLNSNAATDTDGALGIDAGPSLAVGPDNRWITVWYSAEDHEGLAGTDSDIFLSHSDDGGQTWSPVALLNSYATSDTGQDLSPVIASGDSGFWLVAWHSNADLYGEVGTDFDIFLSRSIDDGVNWSIPTTISRRAEVNIRNDERPQVGADGHGTWLVTWDSEDQLAIQIGVDRDILFSRSENILPPSLWYAR